MQYNDHQITEKANALCPYTFDELLECSENNFHTLSSQRLAVTQTHEISDLLDRLSVEDKHTILKKLSRADVSDVIAEMDAEDSAEVLHEMHDLRAIQIIESLEPDDAADVLRELPNDDRERLLTKIPQKISDVLRSLLTYDPDTAGGVMTPFVTTIDANMTTAEALDFLRARKDETENLDEIYVLDHEKKLVGVLGLRILLWADPSKTILQIMNSDLACICRPEQDKETVAQIMAENNCQTLPVVNSQNRLLGIITHDDVIDIIIEEATEDIQKLHGAGANETIHDDVFDSLKKRFPWLFINLLIAFITSKVVSFFEGTLQQMTVLAVFMSTISGLSGNAGAQTLAVAIRSFALDEFKDADVPNVLMREMIKGILNGMGIGLCAAVIIAIWQGSLLLGIVILLAMFLSISIAGLAGAFVPISLRRLHFDPAQSSYIILSTITDIVGLSIFLGLGALVLL